MKCEWRAGGDCRKHAKLHIFFVFPEKHGGVNEGKYCYGHAKIQIRRWLRNIVKMEVLE